MDKNRYIDFIAPSGQVKKIEYPNFFRMKWNTGDLTKQVVRDQIKTVLDAKSAEINALISAENPAVLSGTNRVMYDTLKNGDYPTITVDLFRLLSESQSSGTGTASTGTANVGTTSSGAVDFFTQLAELQSSILPNNGTPPTNGDSEILSTLIDSIIWYNQTNATSKYAFILENYLDRDGNREYPLAGHKSDYEIAYIGGPGDAANMYVKLDPAAKSGPPPGISEIQADYGAHLNMLHATNISSFNEEGKFKC